MNSNSSFSERRVSFSSPRQSVEMMAPQPGMMAPFMMMPPLMMAPQSMAPGVRRSIDMSPYVGSPLQSSSQVVSPATLSNPQLGLQPSPGSQGQVIKALADEVQRLKILVEEKRAREKAAAAGITMTGAETTRANFV